MMPTMIVLHLYTDGGSRGNPGPAGIGMVLETPTGQVLVKEGRTIGEATNNEAEYRALIEGLKLVHQYNPGKLLCFLDSSLVVNQLNGSFKVKKAHLQKLVFEVQKELGHLKNTEVEFKHIPREENEKADALLNQALSSDQG